jgi:hypothetical protein
LNASDFTMEQPSPELIQLIAEEEMLKEMIRRLK